MMVIIFKIIIIIFKYLFQGSWPLIIDEFIEFAKSN